MFTKRRNAGVYGWEHAKFWTFQVNQIFFTFSGLSQNNIKNYPWKIRTKPLALLSSFQIKQWDKVKQPSKFPKKENSPTKEFYFYFFTTLLFVILQNSQIMQNKPRKTKYWIWNFETGTHRFWKVTECLKMPEIYKQPNTNFLDTIILKATTEFTLPNLCVTTRK